MSLPTLKAQFDALLKLPSISCTQPALDQSNLAVIEQLAPKKDAPAKKAATEPTDD